MEIEVFDVMDLKFTDIDTMIDVDHSAAQYMMAAAWRISEQKGLDIKW